MRTFGAIALGSCAFGILSLHAHGVIDTTRIAAQVVTGMGFLGAGLIFRHENTIAGLTTAATLWGTAAIGLEIAFDMYLIGIVSTIVLIVLLSLPRFDWWASFVRKK